MFDGVLAELDRGRSAALALVGEPGIGKTRLLAELAARADAHGHLVLGGSASELEGDLPFGVFVDALDEYVLARSTRLAGRREGRRDPREASVLRGALQALALDEEQALTGFLRSLLLCAKG